MPIRVRRTDFAATVLAAASLAASAGANAAAFTPGNHGFLDTGGNFTQIDVPGATSTQANGINGSGEIVGNYSDVSGSHGFLDFGGKFTTIDVPGATYTAANGINDAGQIVGTFFSTTNFTGYHGFLDTGGSFTQIDVPVPGSPGPPFTYTWGQGINDAGQIVGMFQSSQNAGNSQGFLDTGGNFTQIDVPGANFGTSAEGINGAGQIIGTFSSGGFPVSHGFLLDTGGNLTQIDAPGANTNFPGGTSATGINDAGQIVGAFKNSTGEHSGFLDTGGNFTQIDVPGATSTQANGINGSGEIVGQTFVSGGMGDPHFTTYTGVNYDFQGIGDFLLARSSVAGDQFDVEIRTGAWSNGTSLIEGAAATLCNHQVTFDVDHASAGSSFVWLDGSPISLSVGGSGLALGACKIFEPSSMEYQVVWDTGETLDITDYGTWLAVSSQLSSIDGPGSVEGLLASEIDPDRWRVTGTASPFDPVPEPTSLSLLSISIGFMGIAIMRRGRLSKRT